MKKEREKINKELSPVTISNEGMYDGHGLLENNFNGFVIGSSGTGMSFVMKMLMTSVMHRTPNTNLVIIDSKGEYTEYAEKNDGRVVKIAPFSPFFINPMEIHFVGNIFEGVNPIHMKAEFITDLLSIMVGEPLDSIQESIVLECVYSLYAPFIRDCILQVIPKHMVPTLTDLHAKLKARPEPDAELLALVLEPYTQKGLVNFFSCKSNVHRRDHLTVYDVSQLDDDIKPIAMLVILDFVRNTLLRSKRDKCRIWACIPDGHHLFKSELVAQAYVAVWKSAEKSCGMFTCISTELDTLLSSDTYQVFSTISRFILMVNTPAKDGLLYDAARGLVPFTVEGPIYKEVE